MALDLNSGPYLYQEASLPDSLSDWAVCGWFYTDLLSSWDTLFAIENASNSYVYVECNPALANWQLYTSFASPAPTSLATSIGKWYFVAIVGSANGVQTHYQRALDSTTFSISASGTGTPFTPTRLTIGDNVAYSPEVFDGKVHGIKLFNRELTQAELLRESYFTQPVTGQTTSDPSSFRRRIRGNPENPNILLGFWPLEKPGDYRDYSGNGAHLTLAGTGNPLYGVQGPHAWRQRKSRIFVPAASGITGTGALSAQSSSISGTGEVEHTGTGSLASQVSQISGTGEIIHTGTGDLSAQVSKIAGTGEVGTVVTGTGALSSQASSISGTGEVTHTGTGDLQSQSSSISATGEVTHTGTGALSSQSSQIAGTGALEGLITGTGDLQSQVSSVSGAGEITHTGTGDLQAQVSQIAGTGAISGLVSGTGDLQAQASQITGVGVKITTINGTGTLSAQSSIIVGVGSGGVTLEDLQAQIAALQAIVDELYIRLDLDPTKPNTYANDGSSISNSDFTLTKSDNGDGTFTIIKT